MPGDLLALESKLDSLSEKYNLSGLEFMLNDIGYNYLGVADFENAMQVLELNTRLYPHNQNVWDSYAEVFLVQMDTTNAIQYYQKALDCYPCNLDIEKKLKALQP
jgi:Tfp pilus assembly protein PilF